MVYVIHAHALRPMALRLGILGKSLLPIVVLYSFVHVCLYIYTVYLDNLVSLYCVIVLVVLSSIYYCLLIIFHDIR